MSTTRTNKLNPQTHSQINNKPNEKHKNKYTNPKASINNNKIENIKSKNTETVKSLKICSWNCNSIRKKGSQIRSFILKEKINVMGLCEIKCLDEEANYDLKLEGYKTFYKTRTAHGGGVALIIQENLAKEINELEKIPLEVEATGATIKIQGKKVAIICYYAPPNKDIHNDFIKSLLLSFDEILVMRDLNAHITPFAKKNNKNG